VQEYAKLSFWCLFWQPRAAAGAAAPHSAEGALSAAEADTLAKMLRWPAPSLFPALDIARMLALNEAAAKQLAASIGAFEAAEPSGVCLFGY
jgi:hypothetical protein